MKSPDYVATLAILNEMLRRISSSLPQIEQATRGLLHDKIPLDAAVSANGSGEANL